MHGTNPQQVSQDPDSGPPHPGPAVRDRPPHWVDVDDIRFHPFENDVRDKASYLRGYGNGNSSGLSKPQIGIRAQLC